MKDEVGEELPTDVAPPRSQRRDGLGVDRVTNDPDVEVVPSTPVSLTFKQAMHSPCLSCKASPCCTHLLLRKFSIEDLGDVDYVLYVSNFTGILLDVDAGGNFRVYLSQACGFLDDEGLCKVHGTPAQPSICSHYNAHACRYRFAMTADLNPAQPLLDARRARWYAEQVTFDETRHVVDLPDWDKLLEAFATMPLDRTRAPIPPENSAQAEWRQIVLSGRTAATTYDDLHFHDRAVLDPCNGCAAYCCSNLVFPRQIPTDASEFDFFRYCLGFPSVELSIAEESWTVVVRTSCSHLAGGRCSLFGKDERPLRCSYYDPLKCAYRDHFEEPVPSDQVRVTREEFAVLAGSVVFDATGRVRRVPTVELLKARIEASFPVASMPYG